MVLQLVCQGDLVFLWNRKCKLATTGPWLEIPPITLSDVTILPCAAQSSVDVVPLWAISNKGDVLCRLGVTTLTPAVTSLCCKHVHFWGCVISHLGGQEVCFIIYKDYIKYVANLFCCYVFYLRDHHGYMLGPTSPSSLSPSGLPARCGVLPGTVLPFTEAPSQPRVLQVWWIRSPDVTEPRHFWTCCWIQCPFCWFVFCPPLQETAGTTSPPLLSRSWSRCLSAGRQSTQ